MAGRHANLVRNLLASVTQTAGSVPATTRAAIQARAAQLVGGVEPSAAAPVELPADLAAYVDTVIRHAWRVTDDDVARLTRAGHSDDTIFEATVTAAVGAGTSRLARALDLLHGDR